MVPEIAQPESIGDAPMPRVCIVGPFPPPSGGMANQCQQLIQLLKSEGMDVQFVRTNSPYQPAWAGKIPVLRSLFRLVPYLANLWRVASKVDVVHLLANSGWAWHLYSTPVIVIGRLRGIPVIVNYRGGNADTFFAAAPRYVLSMLAKVSTRVTPSVFLQRVFAKHGLVAEVIPNIIDLSRFSPRVPRAFADAPHIIVTRNLEPIYDIPTAIRAFALIKKKLPGAVLTVAGSGPELENLKALAASLQLVDSVTFSGRIDNASIPSLYRSADCMINSSTVDNMPISILEAFASRVPVISTDAGGIPDLVAKNVTGMLVPIGDSEAIARDVLRVLHDEILAASMTQAAFAEVQKYAWPQVRAKWLSAYTNAARQRGAW